MIIWLAIFVPIITAFVLAKVFKKNIRWWELIIPLVVSFILISLCKYFTETVQTRDIEYWGSYVTRAEYYEPWDEEVPCQHKKYETRDVKHTDSDGEEYTTSEEVFVGYEHAYDVDDHPAHWQVVDSINCDYNISQNDFDRFVRQFGNREFVDLGRDYHSRDGDKYVATWKGEDQTLEPVTSLHAYENRPQASSLVYKFEDVDPEDKKSYGLYDYPEIENIYDCPSILGYKAPERAEAERAFELINAKLGALKQVRVWVLVFTDKPLEAALEQESLWKGSNKNEFVICVGINKSKEVKWTYVFSWSDSEMLKIKTKRFIREQKKLDLVSLSKWLEPELKAHFVRKDFEEFSYLTVDPPMWMVVLTFFLTIALNVGISFWLVTNEYDEETDTHQRVLRWKRKY